MKKRKKAENVCIVPWGSWKEWDCVRAAFFSGTPSRISSAVDRVTVWQTRARVPIAVEVTANLLSIQQRDPAMREKIPENLILSDELLRLMYAMSIMRLINGVVDDKKNYRFGSVASRACQAELPHLLVTIRHNSAHGELPAISLLRMASVQALEWIQVFYWQRQKATLQAARSNLKSILIDYVTMLQNTYVPCEELNGQDKKQLKRVRHDRDLKLHKLIKASESVPQELVSILLDDSLLENQVNDDEDSDLDRGELSSIEDLCWKFAMSKLTLAMPQLLPMLALGIVRRLSGLEAVADGAGYSSVNDGSGVKVAAVSGDLEVNRLTDWFRWLLGSSKRKAKRIPVKPEMEIGLEHGGVHGQISRELFKEILSSCLKQEIRNKTKMVKLVGETYLERSNASKLAEKLCGFSSTTTMTNRSGLDDRDEQDDQDQAAVDLNSLEAKLAEMRQTQQERISSGLGHEDDGSVETRIAEGGNKRPRWKLARDWQPCAIGMLPSSCYPGGVRPGWLLQCSKELCSSNENEIEQEQEQEQELEQTVVDRQKKPKICDEMDLLDDVVPAAAGQETGTVSSESTARLDPEETTTISRAAEGVENAVESTKGCLRVNGMFQKLGPELLSAIQREIRVL